MSAGESRTHTQTQRRRFLRKECVTRSAGDHDATERERMIHIVIRRTINHNQGTVTGARHAAGDRKSEGCIQEMRDRVSVSMAGKSMEATASESAASASGERTGKERSFPSSGLSSDPRDTADTRDASGEAGEEDE